MAETNTRKNNLKALWADPRKRMMIIIMAAVAGTMLAVGLIGGNDEVAEGSTGTSTVNAPPVEARPGLVADRDYVEAVEDENAARLAQAQASGETVLPTLTSGVEPPPLDPLANAPTPDTPGPLPGDVIQPQPVITTPPATQPTTAPQVPAAAPQAADLSRTERYKTVEAQIQNYMQAWAPVAGAQEFQYNGMLPREATPSPATPTAPAGASGQAAAGQAPSTRSGASFVRAGTIVPAVLLTPINSDVPGPVVAQIVSGPLAGARVLGNFQATEKQVVVRFETLSMPGQPRSFGINAYAVNEGLGTGLATDVDNHYLRRYGLLLAAGFMEGYGRAISRSGTTTHVTDGGGIIVTQDDLSTDEIRKVALGQAGTTLAGEIAQRSNVPPTVKVEGKDGAGVPIGLLFMSDF